MLPAELVHNYFSVLLCGTK